MQTYDRNNVSERMTIFSASRLGDGSDRQLKSASPADAGFMAAIRCWPVSPTVWRLSTTALGLVIVALVGISPLQWLLTGPTSVPAVVNARVVTLRAPINGEVKAGSVPLDLGAAIGRGDILFRIINRHADHSRMDDLIRQIEQLKDERPAVEARLATARAQLQDVTEQTQLFVEARIRQLEARQEELRAEVAAAQARSVEAITTLERFTTLAGKGWLPRSQFNQAQRDGSVAEKLEAAAHKRLEAVSVELAAAQRGVFVSINNNDRPRYMQRADQLEQQVSNYVETLAEYDRRMMRLNNDVAKERAHYTELAAADVVAPAGGSLREVLAGSGEQVRHGQELLRMLDCSSAAVTADVDEAVYSRLQVGSRVRFKPRDEHEDLPGVVIRLGEASASPSNLAIRPSVPMRGSYHIIVAVPKLIQGLGCAVGRVGSVIFEYGPWEAMAAAAAARTRETR